MVVHQAMKKCPELIVIRLIFIYIVSYSRAFMKIAYSYTPHLEADLQYDECYPGYHRFKTIRYTHGNCGEHPAKNREELGLPCSIGIAPNKLLAKMASDLKKA